VGVVGIGGARDERIAIAGLPHDVHVYAERWGTAIESIGPALKGCVAGVGAVLAKTEAVWTGAAFNG